MHIFKNFSQKMLTKIHCKGEFYKEARQAFYGDIVENLPKRILIVPDRERYRKLEFYALVDAFSEFTNHREIQEFYFDLSEINTMLFALKCNRDIEELDKEIVEKLKVENEGFKKFSRMMLLSAFRNEYQIRYSSMFRVAKMIGKCGQIVIRYTDGEEVTYYERGTQNRLSYSHCNSAIVYQFVKGTEIAESSSIDYRPIESIRNVSGTILWENCTPKSKVV